MSRLSIEVNGYKLLRKRDRIKMKIRGINSTVFGGNISKVEYAKTDKGQPCCTFAIASEIDGRVTWARINVYGELVNICDRFSLSKGDYVAVQGSLMNRNKSGNTEVVFLEIRAFDIVFFEKPQYDNDSFDSYEQER
jgi:single-stranded DNA-binding protein